MSPLRGGEADKFGNRYEGRWTTRELLYVLLGQVDSVTVEEVGEIGKGVEFTVRRMDSTEVHQVNDSMGVPINGSCLTLKLTACWQLPDIT